MKTEKNILIAFILNLIFSFIEFLGGIFTNSIAIMSDSIHDMADALSIGISYFLERKSKREPDEKYTYGYVRFSVIGSIITTAILLVSSILIIYNSIKLILSPMKINYNGMLIIAIIGFIINLFAVYFTKDGHSLNQKSVNLHMLEDVLGWLIVLIGSLIMKFTNFVILDPILSIFIAIFIFISAIKNMKQIINLFLEKIPDNISISKIKDEIMEDKKISGVHHIHVWSIDGFNNYATMHIVTNNHTEKLKKSIRKKLESFNIVHVTLELESENEKCNLRHCNSHTNHDHNHVHKH